MTRGGGRGALGTAQRIAEALRGSSAAVVAVCVYGSVARGEAGRWSDLDMLVVGTDPDLSGARLAKLLPEEARTPRLSLMYRTTDALEELLRSGDSFGLHLRAEAVVLWETDASFTSLLRATEPGPDGEGDVGAEMALELAKLHDLEEVDQYNGLYHFAGAQLFSVGKSVVILRLLREGSRVFDRRRAFRLLAEQHPELSAELSAIERLEPNWRSASRRLPRRARHPRELSGSDVTAAVMAIRAIAA